MIKGESKLNFFKKYSYIAVRLFLNQFAISLFGVALAFVSIKGERDGLLLWTSIFSIVFFLFLQYAVIWEVGAKDGISAVARNTSRGLGRGFLIALLTNSLNLLCALLVLTEYIGVPAVGGMARGAILIGLEGMYMGVLKAMPTEILPLMFFVITIPSILVIGVGYIIGSYNLHATNILIPKNKDVKNNGRPKHKK